MCGSRTSGAEDGKLLQSLTTVARHCGIQKALAEQLQGSLGPSKHSAPLAQLDRASGYEPEGREFESLRARHFSWLFDRFPLRARPPIRPGSLWDHFWMEISEGVEAGREDGLTSARP